MYQILGISRAISLFGLLLAAVIVIWVKVAPPHDPASITEWWKLTSGAASASGAVVFAIGETAIFPLLCRVRFVRHWFPPLEGEWDVELESNWATIQKRSEPDRLAAKTAAVKAKVEITARLFRIRINLTSNSGYSGSHTVAVRLTRDPEDGSVRLNYIYLNTTDTPAPTDSGSHYGAAVLKVRPRGTDVYLEGLYWTNRNWTMGLNTAGTVKFERSASS